MISNDRIIKTLIYGDPVSKIAAERSVGLTEARAILSQMSFKEYRQLEEAGASITPPSGQTIGPSGPSSSKTPSGPAGLDPAKTKAIWPGKGAPIEVGMTVGLKGPNGLPVPGQVSQVDMSAKGVKIKNPTTGQDEWTNLDMLEPFMAQGDQEQPTQPGQQDTRDLARLQELAGIRENASCGATGAGAIAVAPAAMGKVKRRQSTEEQVKKEYTPKEPAKTIVGDTKPNQASGELSANLAVRGKKTASRTNNGFKK